jgi:hypothetical protein
MLEKWYREQMGEQDDWIDCKDRLPEESDRYWCYCQEQNDLGLSHFQWNCYFDSIAKIWLDRQEFMSVTHWQPLPTAPLK